VQIADPFKRLKNDINQPEVLYVAIVYQKTDKKLVKEINRGKLNLLLTN